MRFSGIAPHRSWAAIAIAYTNTGTSPRYARLHVNEAVDTWIELPPTGKQERTVWIEAKLNPRAANTLAFFAGCHPGPRISSIEVH